MNWAKNFFQIDFNSFNYFFVKRSNKIPRRNLLSYFSCKLISAVIWLSLWVILKLISNRFQLLTSWENMCVPFKCVSWDRVEKKFQGKKVCASIQKVFIMFVWFSAINYVCICELLWRVLFQQWAQKQNLSKNFFFFYSDLLKFKSVSSICYREFETRLSYQLGKK